MSDNEKQVWHLWRDGIPYTLLVWPPSASSMWCVDIHAGHVDKAIVETWLHTMYLDRGTHLVADCYDIVGEKLKEREGSG